MGKHRKPSRARRTLRAIAATLAAGAILTGIDLAAGGPADAQTVPAAHASACRAFARWWNATEGGYRYEPALVARIERRAQAADAPLWGDVWALAQVAQLAAQVQSPEQRNAATAAIDAAAGRVALDCAIKV